MALTFSAPRDLAGDTPPALQLRLWYPAAASGQRAAYGVAEGVTGWRRRLFVTHSSWNALPASGERPFPVLVYIPGWGGARHDNTVLSEDLASQGFVVAAIDDLWRGLGPDNPLNASIQFGSEAAGLGSRRVGRDRAQVEAALASAVLDKLYAGPAAVGLTLNLASCSGIIGYSFGGAAAVEAGQRDLRFKAVLNLDGWLFGESRSATPPPYFFVNAQGGSEPEGATGEFDRNDAQQQQALLTRSGGYMLTMGRATHNDLTDDPLLSIGAALRGKHLEKIAISSTVAALLTYFAKDVARLLA